MSEENKSGTKLFKLIRIIILLIAIAFSGCILYQKTSNKGLINAQKNVNIPQSNLYDDVRIKNFASRHKSILKKIEITKIEDSLLNEKSYACIAVKNKSNSPISNFLIVIDLYDKDGNIITDSSDSIKSFASNAEYTFKIPITRGHISHWEVADIDEY